MHPTRDSQCVCVWCIWAGDHLHLFIPSCLPIPFKDVTKWTRQVSCLRGQGSWADRCLASGDKDAEPTGVPWAILKLPSSVHFLFFCRHAWISGSKHRPYLMPDLYETADSTYLKTIWYVIRSMLPFSADVPFPPGPQIFCLRVVVRRLCAAAWMFCSTRKVQSW